MKSNGSPSFSYPHRLGRLFLISLEEIIGRNGLNAVMNHARLTEPNTPTSIGAFDFQFETISLIQHALQANYGLRGGQGLALRAGRAAFKHLLREYGPELGLADPSFKLLPVEDKVRLTSEVFAQLFNQYSDQCVEFSEAGGQYRWAITRCPFCWQRQADDSVCLQIVGLLQEALYWVSSGQLYDVEEVACIARGDPSCVIVIDKQPLS